MTSDEIERLRIGATSRVELHAIRNRLLSPVRLLFHHLRREADRLTMDGGFAVERLKYRS